MPPVCIQSFSPLRNHRSNKTDKGDLSTFYTKNRYLMLSRDEG